MEWQSGERVSLAWNTVAERAGSPLLDIGGVGDVLSELGMSVALQSQFLPSISHHLNVTGKRDMSVDDFMAALRQEMRQASEKSDTKEDDVDYETFGMGEAEYRQLSQLFDSFSGGTGSLDGPQLQMLLRAIEPSLPVDVCGTLCDELGRVVMMEGHVLKGDFVHVFARIREVVAERGGGEDHSSPSEDVGTSTPLSPSGLETVKLLRAEVKEANAKLRGLEVRNATLFDNNERLQNELNAARTAAAELGVQVKEQEREASGLAGKLGRQEELDEKLRTIREEVEAQSGQLEESAARERDLQKENARLSAERTSSSSALAGFAAKVEALEGKVLSLQAALREERSALSARVDEVQMEADTAATNAAEATEEAEKLHDALAVAQAENDNLERELLQVRSQATDYAATITRLELGSGDGEPVPVATPPSARRKDAEAAAAHAAAEIAARREAAKAAEEQLDTLRKQIINNPQAHVLSTRLEEAEAQLVERDKSITAGTQRLAETEKRLAEEAHKRVGGEKEQASRLLVLQRDIALREEELAQQTKRNEELNTAMAASRARITSAEREISDCRNQVSSLEQELERRSLELAGSGESPFAEEMTVPLETVLRESREEIDSLQQLLRASEKEKRHHQKREERLKAALRARASAAQHSWWSNMLCCFPQSYENVRPVGEGGDELELL